MIQLYRKQGRLLSVLLFIFCGCLLCILRGLLPNRGKALNMDRYQIWTTTIPGKLLYFFRNFVIILLQLPTFSNKSKWWRQDRRKRRQIEMFFVLGQFLLKLDLSVCHVTDVKLAQYDDNSLLHAYSPFLKLQKKFHAISVHYHPMLNLL